MPPWRVILRDDASGDDTVEHLERWAARSPIETLLLVNPTNRGLTATLNAALDQVRTAHYAYISADDVMRHDRVEKQLTLLLERPDVAFVYSDARMVDEEGVDVEPSFVARHARGLDVSDDFESLLQGNWIPAASIMCRTGVVRELGGYDEDLFFEDYDLLLRLASGHPFGHVAEPLVDFRTVGTSLGTQRFRIDRVDWMWARVVIWAKHLDRDPVTRSVVALKMRPVLISLATKGEQADRLAPYFRAVAEVDRGWRSRAYAAVSGRGWSLGLRTLARARVPTLRDRAIWSARGGTRTRTPEGTRT